MDLWTELLALVSQVVTPIWNELIQYIPLLFLLLIPLVLYLLVVLWRMNAGRNAPRIARRLPDGRTPEGLHLPSPSRWPLVGSLGAGFIFASLVFSATSEIPARDAAGQVVEGQMITVNTGPNLVLLTIGLMIGALAFVGWLIDARKEYDATAAGDHHLVLVEETPGTKAPVEIPEGIHLPPPSPWPFFAPIGLFFMFLGLVLGPVMIVGGLAMGLIAMIGWLLDAGREYREVAEGEHMDPELRNPERIWPRRLVPVFVGIAILSVSLSVGNNLLALLPKTEEVEAGGPVATTTPYVSALTPADFEQQAIIVPAETPFTITFENRNVGVEHNIEIFSDAAATEVYYLGEYIAGPETIEYAIDPLAAGEYPFICTIHPNMKAVLIVQ